MKKFILLILFSYQICAAQTLTNIASFGHQIEISGIKQKSTLRLLDINGRQILSKQSTDENVSLHLPKGINEGFYIIEISDGTNLINKKIIIR